MKEFLNWLGVNEKIAKLVVWLFLIMGFLIMFNTLLESIGLPFYKVTVENLSKIKLGKFLDYMCTVIVSLFNFLSIIFLVIRIKNIKKVLPYSILYLVLLALVCEISYMISQIFIIVSCISLVCYLTKSIKKGILLGTISIFVNILMQYICYYLPKLRFTNNWNGEGINYLLTSIDYFIVMFFIILVKEVYLKYKKEA